jgi:putative restriction endonuclease
VEAAHIRPVAAHGPDSRRNGIALSRTLHWLFDRGIVSMENDGRILKADALIPPAVAGILRPEGYARVPDRALDRPHPEFLRWHRENVFQG